MGPDFNNNGRIDGYDLGTLESIGELNDGYNESDGFGGGNGSGGDNMGCGDIVKYGCLLPALVLIALSAFLTFMVYACTGTNV